ncbi:MAG: ankyrin repeat domain-containing protein [Synergistaceae bacterium]|nr:ankyrin repeat domain-containing protein [Synergistaceae bacterium]
MFSEHKIYSAGYAGFKSYEGEEPFIFISYSHSDAHLVFPIIKLLHAYGFRVWYDWNVTGSYDDYMAELREHIKKCSVFMYFISQKSLKSSECIDECNTVSAIEKNKNGEKILFVLVDLEAITKKKFNLSGNMEKILLHNHITLSTCENLDSVNYCLRKKLLTHENLKRCREENSTDEILDGEQELINQIWDCLKKKHSTKKFFVLALGLIFLAGISTLYFWDKVVQPAPSITYSKYSLHKAAESNPDTEFIRTLLKHGFDVNERDAEGYTPLMRSINNPNPEVVKILLEAGADFTLKLNDEIDDTALTLAARQRNSKADTVKYLLEAEYDTQRQKILSGDVKFWRSVYLEEPENSRNYGNWVYLDKAGNVDSLEDYHSWRTLYYYSGNLPVRGFKTTLLGLAVMTGNSEVVDYLLKAGCDVNAEQQDKIPMIMLASVFSNNIETVKLIAETGNINSQDVHGYTALMEAASYSSPEIVSTLLASGADVNILSEQGRTALMCAASRQTRTDAGKLALIIRMLVSAGADVKVKDENGKSAIDYARDNDLLKDNQAILKLLSFDEKDIFDIAKNGTLKELEEAYESGVSFDVRNENGDTLLHMAALNRDASVINALTFGSISLQGLYHEKNKNGETPLDLAVKYNLNPDVIKCILDVTLPPVYPAVWLRDEVSASGVLLHQAALNNPNPEIMRMLIKELGTAGINAKNVSGDTPLMLAVKNYNSDVVKVLLENKADTTLRNKHNETALSLAAAGFNPEVVKILFEAEDDTRKQDIIDGKITFGVSLGGWWGKFNLGKTLLGCAVTGWPHTMEQDEKKDEIIDYLIEKGCKVNAKGEYGNTALITAIACLNSDDEDISYDDNDISYLISKLLEAGAEVNSQDFRGITALMCAVRRLSPETINTLLEHGANVNLQDNDGNTALMHALLPEQLNDDDFTDGLTSEIINILIKAGADVNIKDKNHDTALILAAKKFSQASTGKNRGIITKIIHALIRAGADVNIINEEGKSAEDFVDDEEIFTLPAD